MAEVKNNFIRSKMNKDLDARLVPPGEYRNAINAQISRSEGEGVGSLENILGNKSVAEFESSVSDLSAIGYLVDEVNNDIYIFLTDNNNSSGDYVPTGAGSNNFIYKYNEQSGTSTKLVEGAFLNFHKQFPIYGVNLLENLLFFTDNRNQPRKINVTSALNDATYYTTEDQISVAKYNPYAAIRLYELSSESGAATDQYQTTMKDVVSKFLPNGGLAVKNGTQTGSNLAINSLNIPFYPDGQSSGSDNLPQNGMTLGKITAAGNAIVDTGVTISTGSTTSNIVVSSSITLDDGDELVFNFNPYYDPDYAGDDAFLEDKFARFSYRFKYDDGEYSLIAPFTQPCFIPKQDGYFLNTAENEGDQQQATSSTIVSFMENKVNSIGLQIPLPTIQSSLQSDYKVQQVDIIYKESDGLTLKVIESIPVSQLTSSDNTYEYVYTGKKPYKTLPENELTRVYDRVPVRSLAQEVTGNRVVYSNFQNKHTPPPSLDYNVSATEKFAFDIRDGSATVNGDVTSSKTINLSGAKGTIEVGSKISWSGSPDDLVVQTVTGSPTPTSVNVTENVTVSNGTALTFQPSSDDKNFTSTIEYPNHTLKTNRSYQVGIVLLDRYGRTSDVVLSNNTDLVTIGTENYSGPSLYSPYIDEDQNIRTWRGNSLKISFNSVIDSSGLTDLTFWPGIYNGDVSSVNYNPLGWYSYKVVVQQKEQEYYNVYTAGAVKGDLDDTTSNLNTTFVTLINDNINKVPRDLSEVGPQDKTFRSSVQLFGRVVNNVISYDNEGNEQYYPGRRTFTTDSIQPGFDLFNYDGSSLASTDYENALYRFASNPLTAQITTSLITSEQFGLVNTVSGSDYNTFDNLVVLETEPVVSLLDIYYETTTSGLINDLNYAISNDIGGGTGLSSLNTAPFSEAIGDNDDIFQSDFSLVDEFGVDLPAGDISSLIINSAFDTQDPPQDVSSYFTLNGSANSYNIEVEPAFVNNVYFGSNSGARRFNLELKAELTSDDVPVFYDIFLSLDNEAPVIYSNAAATTPIGSSVNTPKKSINDLTIFTVYGRNGANTTDNPNTGKDLTWQIVSATDVDGNDADQYFMLSVTSTDAISTCVIKRIDSNPIPIKDYIINLKLFDAGSDSDEVVVNVKMGDVVSTISERTYNIGYPEGQETTQQRYVQMHFPSAAIGEAGYYIYVGSWAELSNDPNNNILIDRAGAIQHTSVACASQGGFYYNGSDVGLIHDKLASCEGGTFEGSEENIDLSSEAENYGFEIQS